MTTLVVGPFNRVEGDLEVHLGIDDGRVREARVTAPLYRGFERMLEGRDPRDALTIVPRISASARSVSRWRRRARWGRRWGLRPRPRGHASRR